MATVPSEKKTRKQQITFTLRGADMVSFQKFKSDQRLTKDAEVAQKLVRERLAELGLEGKEVAA